MRRKYPVEQEPEREAADHHGQSDDRHDKGCLLCGNSSIRQNERQAGAATSDRYRDQEKCGEQRPKSASAQCRSDGQPWRLLFMAESPVCELRWITQEKECSECTYRENDEA